MFKFIKIYLIITLLSLTIFVAGFFLPYSPHWESILTIPGWLFMILPWVLILGGFYSGLKKAHQAKPPFREHLFYPLIGALIVSVVYIGFGIQAIFTCHSACTVALTIIWLPIYAIGVALTGFLVCWALLALIRFSSQIFQQTSAVRISPIKIGLLVLAILILCSFAFMANAYLHRNALLKKVTSESLTDLHPSFIPNFQFS